MSAQTETTPKPTQKTGKATGGKETKTRRPGINERLAGTLQENFSNHKLIIENTGISETEYWAARPIDLSIIDPNPWQPRKDFDGIEELAKLIDEQGLLVPIEVRLKGNRYELVSGERRVKAHKLLGKTRILAHVVNITDQESSVRGIVENLGRKDLCDFEKSRAIIRHKAEFGSLSTTHQEFGLTQSTYYRMMAFESLPEAVNTLLDKKPSLITAASAEKTVKFIKEKVESGTSLEALEKALISIIQAALSSGAPIKNLARSLEKKFPQSTQTMAGTEIKSGEVKLGHAKKSKNFYELKLVRSQFSDEQLEKLEEFLKSLKSA
ncbi:ParB/RepB/Spo0J family partition protein [Pseudomonas sp. TSRC2-2]|uniref:ParB/RepB/Spo0J family partition protein n=1 Tax=Pseudomonas sp. TSRC2-2 TaxID=2804571 RepID=UPI003CF5AE18